MKTLLRAGAIVLALSVPCVTGRPATAETKLPKTSVGPNRLSPTARRSRPSRSSTAAGPRASCIGGWRRTVEDRKLDDDRRQRILTLTDPETGLEVRAVATIYPDTPGVDWTLHFTNRGKADTPILEQVRAVDVTAKAGRRASRCTG